MIAEASEYALEAEPEPKPEPKPRPKARSEPGIRGSTVPGGVSCEHILNGAKFVKEVNKWSYRSRGVEYLGDETYTPPNIIFQTN